MIELAQKDWKDEGMGIPFRFFGKDTCSEFFKNWPHSINMVEAAGIEPAA